MRPSRLRQGKATRIACLYYPTSMLPAHAALAKQGAQLIAHGSDFGAVMRMLPAFAKTMKDGLGEG